MQEEGPGDPHGWCRDFCICTSRYFISPAACNVFSTAMSPCKKALKCMHCSAHDVNRSIKKNPPKCEQVRSPRLHVLASAASAATIIVPQLAKHDSCKAGWHPFMTSELAPRAIGKPLRLSAQQSVLGRRNEGQVQNPRIFWWLRAGSSLRPAGAGAQCTCRWCGHGSKR
jgi:hypothetical protein